MRKPFPGKEAFPSVFGRVGKIYEVIIAQENTFFKMFLKFFEKSGKILRESRFISQLSRKIRSGNSFGDLPKSTFFINLKRKRVMQRVHSAIAIRSIFKTLFVKPCDHQALISKTD